MNTMHKSGVKASVPSTSTAAATVKSGAPEARTAELKPTTVDTEALRAKAYALFEARQRAGAPGDAASDWAQAERELGAAPSGGCCGGGCGGKRKDSAHEGPRPGL